LKPYSYHEVMRKEGLSKEKKEGEEDETPTPVQP
jgi:hypothetical protein